MFYLKSLSGLILLLISTASIAETIESSRVQILCHITTLALSDKTRVSAPITDT